MPLEIDARPSGVTTDPMIADEMDAAEGTAIDVVVVETAAAEATETAGRAETNGVKSSVVIALIFGEGAPFSGGPAFDIPT